MYNSEMLSHLHLSHYNDLMKMSVRMREIGRKINKQIDRVNGWLRGRERGRNR